jgi:hypothetical protein
VTAEKTDTRGAVDRAAAWVSFQVCPICGVLMKDGQIFAHRHRPCSSQQTYSGTFWLGEQ